MGGGGGSASHFWAIWMAMENSSSRGSNSSSGRGGQNSSSDCNSSGSNSGGDYGLAWGTTTMCLLEGLRSCAYWRDFGGVCCVRLGQTPPHPPPILRGSREISARLIPHPSRRS